MDEMCKKCVYYLQDRNDCINPRDESEMKRCKHFDDNAFQKFFALEILQLELFEKFKEDARIVQETFDNSFIKNRFERRL